MIPSPLVQTIVILLMLGLLFLGAAPSPKPAPALAEKGMDWLRSFSYY